MREVLDEPLINTIPAGAPGLSRFDIAHFLAPDTPWQAHRDQLAETVQEVLRGVIDDVAASLGEDWSQWRWGDLHQVQFSHRLASHEPWQHLKIGPDPIGGSPNTLGMAVHMGPGPGAPRNDAVACRVFHGPAFRLVVDLADPDHAEFVIAGGNGGSNSIHAVDQYPAWLRGEYYRLLSLTS